MDFPEFYKELEAEFFGAGAKLMGLQLLQLELRLGKTPSRSFRPVKSAEILWQFWASSSFRVSLAHDGSWSKNEQKLHHLEEALPEAPPATATTAVRNAYTRRVTKQQEVACLILIRGATWSIPSLLVLGELDLNSLTRYDQFAQNYNMHDMGKTIPELHAMLKLAEKSIPKKVPAVLAIRQELKKNKASTSGTSGIFTIELFSFPKSNSWIYDTGCGTHICNTIQGLRGYQKLNKGALDLYVGNDNYVAFEAIGSYELILPSGMILVLDNCEHDGNKIERSGYMSPPIRRKYRASVAFATGCRRINKIRRGNRKIRVPIAMWPCKVEEKMTLKEVDGKTIQEFETKIIAKDGTITRVPGIFQGYETSEEESVERPRERDLYGFVDHPQLQQRSHRNEFAPHWLPQSNGNMNGWLVEDEDEVERNEVDSDLESTASSKPVWEKTTKADRDRASYHCPWCSK
ncbi:hypothetical protein Tco_0668420 [Tanacetum coccineum]